MNDERVKINQSIIPNKPTNEPKIKSFDKDQIVRSKILSFEAIRSFFFSKFSKKYQLDQTNQTNQTN